MHHRSVILGASSSRRRTAGRSRRDVSSTLRLERGTCPPPSFPLRQLALRWREPPGRRPAAGQVRRNGLNPDSPVPWCRLQSHCQRLRNCSLHRHLHGVMSTGPQQKVGVLRPRTPLAERLDRAKPTSAEPNSARQTALSPRIAHPVAPPARRFRRVLLIEVRHAWSEPLRRSLCWERCKRARESMVRPCHAASARDYRPGETTA